MKILEKEYGWGKKTASYDFSQMTEVPLRQCPVEPIDWKCGSATSRREIGRLGAHLWAEKMEVGAGMSGIKQPFSFFPFLPISWTWVRGLGVWFYTHTTEQINTLRIMGKGKVRINIVVLGWNWKYQSELRVLTGSRGSDTAVAVSTLSTQI